MRKFFPFIVLTFLLPGLWFFHHHRVSGDFGIQRGETTGQVLRELSERGIISSYPLSYLYARVMGVRVKAGCYSVSGNYTDAQLLSILEKGSPCPISVTIPEGANLFRVASILDEKGICGKEEFLKLSFDREFLSSLEIDAPSLEGFLFPDTYVFDEGTGCRRAVEVFVESFNRKVKRRFLSYKPDEYVRKALGNVTLLKILTVASIVERETSLEGEKPVVASVIYNRLIRGMPLQCDPTVYYSYYLQRRSKFKLHKGDTLINSPYNTYVHRGLPPGPICSPGLDSILAAMYPKRTGFLYFVVRADRRGHLFSKSYNEHLKLVRETFGVGKEEEKKVRSRQQR